MYYSRPEIITIAQATLWHLAERLLFEKILRLCCKDVTMGLLNVSDNFFVFLTLLTGSDDPTRCQFVSGLGLFMDDGMIFADHAVLTCH